MCLRVLTPVTVILKPFDDCFVPYSDAETSTDTAVEEEKTEDQKNKE